MSTLLLIILIVVVIGVIPALIIGFVLTKDGLERQRRIAQMKSFRNNTRPEKATFSEADRRTVV
jgi:hypothetical protein